MPMGNVKGKTNCQVCIDCERMFNIHTCAVSFRCYGEGESLCAPIKKTIPGPGSEGGPPPRIAPEWCPHRKRTNHSFESGEDDNVDNLRTL